MSREREELAALLRAIADRDPKIGLVERNRQTLCQAAGLLEAQAKERDQLLQGIREHSMRTAPERDRDLYALADTIEGGTR